MAAVDLLVEAGWQDHGGVFVNPEARDVPHPTRGTCQPGCPMFGVCHCLCGGRPATAPNDCGPDRTKGMPFAYLRGHGPWPGRGRPGHRPHLVAGSVPTSQIRPLLLWLEGRYGSQLAVAELLGMQRMNYRKLRNVQATCQPRTWRRIKALVLAHKVGSDPLRIDHGAPRFARRRDQIAMDAAERRARRYRRLGRPDPESEEW